jgi:hypothetical protein
MVGRAAGLPMHIYVVRVMVPDVKIYVPKRDTRAMQIYMEWTQTLHVSHRYTISIECFASSVCKYMEASYCAIGDRSIESKHLGIQ